MAKKLNIERGSYVAPEASAVETIRESPAPRAGRTPTKQLGTKIPSDLYDDLQILRAESILRGEEWNLTGLITDFLRDFVNQPENQERIAAHR